MLCLSVLLVACGNTDDNKSNEDMSSNTINASEIESQVEGEEIEIQEIQNTEIVEEETEEVFVYFETDDVVNSFFANYNAIAEKPIEASEIEKGNIRTKALVYIDDFSMEVINATDFLSVSISTDLENEDTELLSVFTSCIKAMNTTVSDDEIMNAWNAIHETGYMVEDYDFNGIEITYVPSKKLSWGTSALRIDLSFPIE